MSLLELKNINSGYGNKQVLSDISLRVPNGEIWLIIGSNGSGKTTLLKVIYGLLGIWEGKIEYEGSVLHTKGYQTPVNDLIGRGIMYIPQKDALFEDMNVEENLQFSLLHLNDSGEVKKRMNKVWTDIPILQQKKGQLVSRLSGGERKLLSLAMVLANRPKLLLYDEPIAGLSEENTQLMLSWLKQIHSDGTTILIVEHRLKEVIDIADRILGLRLGKLYDNSLKTLDDIKKFMTYEKGE